MGPKPTRGIILTTESKLSLLFVFSRRRRCRHCRSRPALSHRGEQYQTERQDDLLAAGDDRGGVATILEILLVVVAVLLESIALVLN